MISKLLADLTVRITLAYLETKHKWEQEVHVAGGNGDSVRNAILLPLAKGGSAKPQATEDREG